MCKRPYLAVPFGKTDKNKIKYKIFAYKDYSGNVKYKNNKLLELKYGKVIEIPCGKCLDCRLSYAKKWSDRCMMELQYHDSSYFITLTYNDDHLPYRDSFNIETGECVSYPSLEKDHFQLFMKRLRKAVYPEKLRFYMCGEYGSHTKRPHYHAIIFGLHLDDLVFYKKSPTGDLMYTSEFLNSLWTDSEDPSAESSRGYVVVGDVTPESCSYVARYVHKKAEFDFRKTQLALGLQPEYTSMSLKPGIGRQFFDDYEHDLVRFGSVPLSTEKGGIKVSMSRYFEKFVDEDQLKKIKEYRTELMEDNCRQKDLSTSQNYLDRLHSEELDLIDRTCCLVRDL